ncbi:MULTISPECIES: hypothetical protein [Xanthomonas]|uniref:hypothetical protein n=1 Tax=Xanthomonas TaxID=338 RepID=UPI00225ABA08|nr:MULTISPECIES: hypothetical protein [Xanthomonas]MDY4283268.1 hypothetical protein [Xanthomonas sp. LF06-19]
MSTIMGMIFSAGISLAASAPLAHAEFRTSASGRWTAARIERDVVLGSHGGSTPRLTLTPMRPNDA